ncbi:hypothetical protein PG994_008135 [Apiospora phragmitis]|uniref:Uncharacterized protein n=1 Tax=Apiospora phragmitis TaxID=2905665 RepID=A0ABR1US62_9PEZI
MGPLTFLSFVLGLAAMAMATMEEGFTPTPVNGHALPKMVQARGATPGDRNTTGMMKIAPATFFYTLDNGTEISYKGEPLDFELEIKKYMPHYQSKWLNCSRCL